MDVLSDRDEVRAWVAASRSRGERIGLVPTMGSLHRGHTSLVDVARRHASRTVLSIFVNPLQFGPGEDFERYPRDTEKDLELAREVGVDLVFTPTSNAIYPDGDPWVTVVPERGADRLCGKSRPGHFRGVLTVVAKLFGIVTPDVAVFGRKDYQQLVLIRRMVADLEMAIEIFGAPTVREASGLALSSRNRYLSPDERRQALALVEALRGCIDLYARGEADPERYRDRLHQVAAAGVSVDYGEVVDPVTLEPARTVDPGVVCAVAGFVGGTRLIDNVMLGTDSLPTA